jgi:hypothetical protein
MIRRRDSLDDGNEIRDLFAAFEKVDDAIDKYLKAYQPTKARSGNHDYFQALLSTPSWTCGGFIRIAWRQAPEST